MFFDSNSPQLLCFPDNGTALDYAWWLHNLGLDDAWASGKARGETEMAGHTASARAERQWAARTTTGALAVAYYHFHECDRVCTEGRWQLRPQAARESQDSTNGRSHVPYPSASKDQAAPPTRQPPRQRAPRRHQRRGSRRRRSAAAP